jgi:hypothetical protein
MQPLNALTKLDSSVGIYLNFVWHMQHKIPLKLLISGVEGYVLAYVTVIDKTESLIEVKCPDFTIPTEKLTQYAAVGMTPNGSSFLASGKLFLSSARPEVLFLAIPSWIDVSQSRETYRTTVGTRLSVCIRAPLSRTSDIFYPVLDISLGGIGCFVGSDDLIGPPNEGDTMVGVKLRVSEDILDIGRMRCAHVTRVDNGYCVGFQFFETVPNSFERIVLDSQRKVLAYSTGKCS